MQNYKSPDSMFFILQSEINGLCEVTTGQNNHIPYHLACQNEV